MNKYDRDIRDIKNTLAELTEVVTELCDRMNENEAAMMARNNEGTETIKFPPNSPFAGHDSYYEDYVDEDNCPPCLLSAMYFNPDGHMDCDIPLKIDNNGVFYCKDGKFAKADNMDSFLMIGNAERPYGLFIPTTIGREGAEMAASFFNDLVNSHNEIDRTINAIRMTQGR